MQEYKDLVQHVLDIGTLKANRTGVDTISTFNYNYEVDLSDGRFPLLTTKKINWKNIVIENLWFLSGNSSWDFLHKHGVHFWDDWVEGDGQLPQAYGEFWRRYPNFQWQGNERTDSYNQEYADVGFDQFRFLVDELSTNINSRRLVLTNWCPPSALKAKLPPCHLMSIFNVQYVKSEPQLCLHMTQRSCDVALGVPYNLAGYAFLLELMSLLTYIQPGIFAHTLVDAHIYVNHVEGLKDQMDRTLLELPTLKISNRIETLTDVEELIQDATTDEIMDCFQIKNYNPCSAIKFEVAV